jgi:hypothetical protein
MAFFHSAFYDLPTSVRKIPALQAKTLNAEETPGFLWLSEF